MYLFIDNTSDLEIILKYYLNSVWTQKVFNGNEEGSLLKSIHQLLSEINQTPKDIKGIAVKVGQGRFTSTRVAITTANTLAYVLTIPVVSVSEFVDKDILEKIQDSPVGQYALASYSAEPNIGPRPKK